MSEYVYIKSEPSLWTVGFYRPDGKFDPESDHDDTRSAAERVRHLNGGTDEQVRKLRALIAEMGTLFQRLIDETPFEFRPDVDVNALLARAGLEPQS